MKDIRIYYECLEQAHFYLEPIVKKVTQSKCKVTLIEISQLSSNSIIADSLSKSLALRNPDGIITMIDENKMEVPLLWIEFTTQVKTLDHSIQGFNSLAAAGESRIPVAKIVANRISPSNHGGAQKFDEKIPFQLLFANYNTPGLQLDWPVTPDGRFAFRNKLHRACPDRDVGLEEILEVILAQINLGISPADALIDHGKRSNTQLAQKLKENLKTPPTYMPPSRSTRFFNINGKWNLKFNRWEHHMDPERGLCEFYSQWLNQKLDALLIDDKASNFLEASKNFSKATGISLNSVSRSKTVDITNEILNSNLNRAGLIIAWYCNQFLIKDKNGNDIVTFKWQISKPSGLKVPFSTAPSTQISQKILPTEDDVTFVLANRFLPENKFEIHSVSYPGAQGDFALIQGAGRTATRKYFDVIAQKNLNGKNIIFISEAKGEATKRIIEKDVNTVIDWRDNPNLSSKLEKELNSITNSQIINSVAYVSANPIITSKTKDLDFMFLMDKDQWWLWSPTNQIIPGISIRNGKCNLPIRYKY